MRLVSRKQIEKIQKYSTSERESSGNSPPTPQDSDDEVVNVVVNSSNRSPRTSVSLQLLKSAMSSVISASQGNISRLKNSDHQQNNNNNYPIHKKKVHLPADLLTKDQLAKDHLPADHPPLDLHNEEDLDDYKPGGYHYSRIGDTLKNGRYLILRKLGWGHFSTVWLAKDQDTNEHVALKIVKSALQYRETALDEIRLLKKIAKGPSVLGKEFVIRILDDFEHYGPNGIHVCMVLELLGENLLSLIKTFNYRGIPLNYVRQITKQVLLGLDYLHRECGIIHTDLKPENVLICIDDVENAIVESKKAPYESELKTLIVSPSKPISTLSKLTKEGQGIIRVKIADLGNSCWVHHHFTDQIQTRQYRSPEVVLGAPWGASADCWSLGCMVFEILTGVYLFDPQEGPRYSKNDDHIAQILELFDNFPSSLRNKGKYSKEYFDAHGNLRRIHKLKPWLLRDVLIQRFRFSPNDAEEISDFLKPLLNPDPSQRATAGERVNHPFLKGALGFESESSAAVQNDFAAPLVRGWSRQCQKLMN